MQQFFTRNYRNYNTQNQISICSAYLLPFLFVAITVSACSEEPKQSASIAVQQHDRVISLATFGDQDRLIISCLPTQGLIKIWDAQKQRLYRQILACPEALVAALSPNCSDIFVGTQRGKLFLIDRRSGAQDDFFLPYGDVAVTALALSPDGHNVYIGSNARRDNICSMDIRQPRYKVASCMSGHKDSITHLAVHDCFLVTGSFDATALVWDTRYLKKPMHHFDEHTWGVLAVAVQASHRRVLTGSVDKKCLIWSLRTPDCGTIVNGTTWITAGALSADGRWAAVGQRDGLIILVQLKELLVIPIIRHKTMVRSLEFSADNQRLLTSSYGKLLVISLAQLLRERL